MKKLRLISLVGITSIALLHTGWAQPHGAGGGGFGGGGFTSGGHSGSVQGAGVASRGGGVGFGRPGITNSRIGQVRSPVRQMPSVSRPDVRGNNSAASVARPDVRGNNSAARQTQT